MKRFFRHVLSLIAVVALVFLPFYVKPIKVKAEIPSGFNYSSTLVIRSKFYTSYENSSENRKSNIKLASKLLNDFFLDVGEEFSFNQVVGERTEKRGFKNAKIIVNGEFIDGVGGGVCQVSTTLYNAVLLAGLKVTEYHPHSLSVSYVSPSFDAMVSFGSADLRFINNTKSPIIINTYADGNRLTVYITGEKTIYRYERVSEIIKEIPFKIDKIVDDGSYPELLLGEEKIINYGKNGLKSKGYLIKYRGEKVIEKRLIRIDTYKSVNGVVVIGQTEREENLLEVLE